MKNPGSWVERCRTWMSTQTGTVQSAASEQRLERVQLLVTALGAVVLAALVELHVEGMNGPAYWKWPWIRVPSARFWPAYGVALLPLCWAEFRYGRVPTAKLLKWLVGGCFALEVAAQGVLSEPFSLARLSRIIESPGAHGYVQVARALLHEPGWLSHYPDLSPSFPLHAKTKPPGVVACHLGLIRLFGPRPGTSAVAALLLGAVATLGVPASFGMTRQLTGSERAGFVAAMLFALSPALGAFFPSFDAVYPALSASLVFCWDRALRGGGAWSLAFGALLMLASLFSYSLLVIGVFLALLSLVRWRSGVLGLRDLFLRSVVGLAVAGLLYAALFFATGFDPIATLRTALASQSVLLTKIPRPYPDTVLFDLTDFLMATGWITFVPAMVAWVRALRAHAWTQAGIIGAVWLQLLVLALIALLPGETIRVWLFLLPLYVMAVAAELSHWTPFARRGFYACVALVSGAVLQNMIFVFVGGILGHK